MLSSQEFGTQVFKWACYHYWCTKFSWSLEVVGAICVMHISLILLGCYQYMHIFAQVICFILNRLWLLDSYAYDWFWSLTKLDVYHKHAGVDPKVLTSSWQNAKIHMSILTMTVFLLVCYVMLDFCTILKIFWKWCLFGDGGISYYESGWGLVRNHRLDLFGIDKLITLRDVIPWYTYIISKVFDDWCISIVIMECP